MTISLKQPQDKLGKRGLLLLIFLLNMTAPMSTDMYLPAFPILLKEFDTTSAMLNITLAGFFISFAIGMLFIGPISDKYGRKPVLLTGLFLYGSASLLCGQADSIELLITWRILQAIGAGGMVSVSTAIVKDSFTDEERPNIIALLQMLGAFAPTVAPLIGAQIIKHYNWHITFDVLAIIAACSIGITMFFQETLPKQQRLTGNVLQSIWSLKEIIVHKPFMTFLVAMGGTSIIYMGFLAVSSYIYIEWFHLTETAYSLFFAVNSLILIVGPRVYVMVRQKYSAKQIINISFTTIIIAAGLILTIGKQSPYLFLLSFAPITFGAGFLRSFSTNILLSQDNMNAGASSSLINFSNTALGAFGMYLGTIGWSNYVNGIGYITLLGSTFSLLLWFIFQKKRFILKGI